MNKCILLGKIIRKIEYEFIINSKNKSIAFFIIELIDKNEVKIKAYNEMADYSYKKFKKNDFIIVEGALGTDGYVEIEEIQKIPIEKNNIK